MNDSEKQETMETLSPQRGKQQHDIVPQKPASEIYLSSSSSHSASSYDSDDTDDDDTANSAVSGVEGPEGRPSKKRKVFDIDYLVKIGFLSRLPPDDPLPVVLTSDLVAAEFPATMEPSELAASSSSGIAIGT